MSRGAALGPAAALVIALALALAALSLAGCRDRQPAGAPAADPDPRSRTAPGLPAAVTALLASRGREAAVAELALDPSAFAAVLASPYDRLHAAYAARFAAAAPAFAAALGRLAEAGPAGAAPVITVRRHYGGDDALSLAQARLRWALPVQASSWVVTVDGAPVDTVWVNHRGRWSILLGLDEASRAPLAALAPACDAAVALAGRPGPCSDAAWAALDGALRGNANRVTSACARAERHCR